MMTGTQTSLYNHIKYRSLRPISKHTFFNRQPLDRHCEYIHTGNLTHSPYHCIALLKRAAPGRMRNGVPSVNAEYICPLRSITCGKDEVYPSLVLHPCNCCLTSCRLYVQLRCAIAKQLPSCLSFIYRIS